MKYLILNYSTEDWVEIVEKLKDKVKTIENNNRNDYFCFDYYIVYDKENDKIFRSPNFITSIKNDSLECKNSKEFIDQIINNNFLGNFTKNDLKTGMIVELENRDRFLVVNDKIIGENDFDCLDNYKNNLNNVSFSELNIIKVYDGHNRWGRGFIKGLSNAEKLIWERNNHDN